MRKLPAGGYAQIDRATLRAVTLMHASKAHGVQPSAQGNRAERRAAARKGRLSAR